MITYTETTSNLRQPSQNSKPTPKEDCYGGCSCQVTSHASLPRDVTRTVYRLFALCCCGRTCNFMSDVQTATRHDSLCHTSTHKTYPNERVWGCFLVACPITSYPLPIPCYCHRTCYCAFTRPISCFSQLYPQF